MCQCGFYVHGVGEGGGLGGLGVPLDGGEIPASLLPIFGSLEVLKVILSKAYLL